MAMAPYLCRADLLPVSRSMGMGMPVSSVYCLPAAGSTQCTHCVRGSLPTSAI